VKFLPVTVVASRLEYSHCVVMFFSHLILLLYKN